MLKHGTRLVAAENPFQQQNGLRNAGGTQSQRIFTFEQGKTIGLSPQCFSRSPLAMTISIGLDHCPGFGCWRVLLDQTVVVQNGIRRNAGANGAGGFHNTGPFNWRLAKSIKVAANRD